MTTTTHLRNLDRVTVPTVEGPRNVTTYGTVVRRDYDNTGYYLVALDRPVMGERVHSIHRDDLERA